MTAPAHIQASSLVASTTSSTDIVLTGVTAGSTLALILLNDNTSTRTYSISDSLNGSWGSPIVESSATGRFAKIFAYIGSASGTVTITIAQSASHVQYYVLAVEIGPSTVDTFGSMDTPGVNSTTQYCAASGSLDTSANVYILSGGLLNASGGTLAKNASATLLGSSTNRLVQYRRSDTALTDERSEWTCTTARNNFAASISFVATGGSSDPLPKPINVNQAINAASYL